MARGYRFGVVGSISTVPNGSTVLPTDDIQIWLKCASIKDKAYTTLAQVLGDSTTLQALITSPNAVDYMVRSTTWASGVTTDSGAMTLIGANNYASNTLLDDSTWLNAICNSTYFESVLNVKVPTMTSDTTPSGECFGSTRYPGYGISYYGAFDGDISTYVMVYRAVDSYVGYMFTNSCSVHKVFSDNNLMTSGEQFELEGSDDGVTYTAIKAMASTADFSSIVNNNSYKYYRLKMTATGSAQTTGFQFFTLQFYGRVDV